MTAANQDIGTSPRRPFVSGDSRVIRVAVTDGATAPVVVSITGAAIKWEVFERGSGPFTGSAVVQKETGGNGIVITNGPGGLFEITLAPEDTEALSGDFYHEAQVILASGDVHTVLIGKFKITADAIE